MNAGPVSDRVYAALRERILGRCYRPGERLDGVDLAEQLASSMTPVRNALYRLAGEGLVETHGGEGFSLPAIDEPGLADLYRWSGDIIGLALRRRAQPAGNSTLACDGTFAARTAALLESLARRSDNDEHARAMRDCNARLSTVRMIEPDLFPDCESELSALVDLFTDSADHRLAQALRSYHTRRTRHASALVRLVYRTQVPAR